MGKRLDPNKTNPATLWTDAKHMRIGAEVLIIAIDDALARSDTTRFEQLIHPTLLLVGSSMEAGFKSYLNQQGLSLDRLRDDFGHDLHKLQKEVLKHADAALADIVKEATPGIGLLNEPYANKRFNYREIGSAMYPSPALVSEWIKVYLAKIKPLVLREKKA
jgi:hypothetical protein